MELQLETWWGQVMEGLIFSEAQSLNQSWNVCVVQEGKSLSRERTRNGRNGFRRSLDKIARAE